MSAVGPFRRSITLSSDEALDVLAATEEAMDVVAEAGHERLAFDLQAAVALLLDRLTDSD